MISDVVFRIHIYVSLLSILSAFFILFRGVRGWIGGLGYRKTDRIASLVFLVSLYLQLILGILNYLSLESRRQDEISTAAEAMENASLRFWAIEHIALMVFALFLSQIGWLVINRVGNPVHRHRNAVFYFGGSLLMIFYSLLMVILN